MGWDHGAHEARIESSYLVTRRNELFGHETATNVSTSKVDCFLAHDDRSCLFGLLYACPELGVYRAVL
jgi:hypothetical protein